MKQQYAYGTRLVPENDKVFAESSDTKGNISEFVEQRNRVPEAALVLASWRTS